MIHTFFCYDFLLILEHCDTQSFQVIKGGRGDTNAGGVIFIEADYFAFGIG